MKFYWRNFELDGHFKRTADGDTELVLDAIKGLRRTSKRPIKATDDELQELLWQNYEMMFTSAMDSYIEEWKEGDL